jgi:flagellar hook-associated protein 1 FlgK
MSNIGSVLYTAKQAILSNLTAINVTGSNIANVSTPGYSRLVPVFESVGTKDPTSTQEQVGVKISEIQRIYNKFIDSQIVAQDSSVGSATSRKDLLTQIEGVLNESSGSGINDALSQFWSAWSDLSANPSGQTERDALVSDAQTLTNVFNQRADELATIQNNADQTIADDVDKLNGYLSDMASMNAEIVQAESAGGSASALRDNRATLLGQISSTIDINYIERSDGSLYIYLPSSGKSLVEESNSRQLQVQTSTANSNLNDIVFADDTANPLNNDITGGEMGGLLNIRDVVLPSYIDELNQTASSIINKVNAQQMAGYDQDGNSGGVFFTPTIDISRNMTEAKYMEVNQAIVANTRKIAASSTVDADGDNATAIAALADDKMYASLGGISIAPPTSGGFAVGQLNNVGQAYKDTPSTSPISIVCDATASKGWKINGTGGYASLSVKSADDKSITLDLNGNGTADITLNLSGTWVNGDTLSFSLAKKDSTTTIDGYYSAFMAKMGQDVSTSSTNLDRETAIATQISTQRESLSGVSLDEEMVNLIKYQMAYNAASRLTKTISDMMDILINLGQ